jgi:hypothetical protein
VKHGLAPRRTRQHDVADLNLACIARHKANLAICWDCGQHASSANPNPQTRTDRGCLTHYLEQLDAIDFE